MWISEEKFKEVLQELGINYKGLTKSGEPRLEYKNMEFTIGRKEKLGENEKGYKIDSIRKIIEKISIEESKEKKISPGQARHELYQKLKKILGGDF